MQRAFENFAQRLVDSMDEVDLHEALQGVAHAFDLRQFAYLSLPASSSAKARLISSYPASWTSHYLRRRYERVDPVVACAQFGDQPFRWGSGSSFVKSIGQHSKVFDEAASFGICCGFTVPIPDRRGGVAALTFAADEPNPPFLRVTDKYVLPLQLIATCFHIHARRTLTDNRTVDGVVLTPREFECLQWAARGKSARDIGSILGVTRRTAAFHLDNVRSKLGVRTISQAVVRLALSRSLLN